MRNRTTVLRMLERMEQRLKAIEYHSKRNEREQLLEQLQETKELLSDITTLTSKSYTNELDGRTNRD